MAPLPGVKTAVAANIRKNPVAVKKQAVSDSGDSKPTIKARASESVRTASPASAENARTARTESKLSQHYSISDAIRKGTSGAVRGNSGWQYDVQKTVDYSTFQPGVAGNGWRNLAGGQRPPVIVSGNNAQANMYAQLNQMYANQMKAQLGAQLGKSAVNFLNNLGSIGGKDNVYSNMSLSDLGSAPTVSTPTDLTSASGVKSAVKNANTSADVYNAKQAADEIKTNLKDELSKIDFSETINSKLDGSIGVEGSDKTLKQVLSDVGVTLDTSALGKITINSDDTSQIITSITQKMEAVENFSNTLEGSTAKITTKSGEVKGTLNATTIRIDQLEAQISTAQAQGADTTALQKQLDQANEQKSKLEIQMKELDAAKKAVEEMGTEATTMQNDLKGMKGKFEDLQEVETTADEKQKKLEQQEKKELTKLEKEAYDLKNKMDAEKDEGKKAKLQEKYNKTCAEFNQIAANTTLEGFAGRAIGENATDSRTVYEKRDDHNQAQRDKMDAAITAQLEEIENNARSNWSEGTKRLVGALESYNADNSGSKVDQNINSTIAMLKNNQMPNGMQLNGSTIKYENGQFTKDGQPIDEAALRKMMKGDEA